MTNEFSYKYESFKKLCQGYPTRFSIKDEDVMDCGEIDKASAVFDSHYIYHTAWAARKLNEIKPELHYDIGSYLYFSTIVSAFIPVRFFDIRPVEVYLPNLRTEFADLTNLLFVDNSVSSLSCMHVIEHVGLGRYGDAVDPNGDLKAISELKRVLAVGGYLLFVVPVGQPRICFHAHRIYSYEQIMEYFSGLNLIEYTLIAQASGNKVIVQNATAEQTAAQRYGCGCFLFKK